MLAIDHMYSVHKHLAAKTYFQNPHLSRGLQGHINRSLLHIGSQAQSPRNNALWDPDAFVDFCTSVIGAQNQHAGSKFHFLWSFGHLCRVLTQDA